MLVTGVPLGGVPVTTAVLVYCPTVAMPVNTQVMLAPAASVVAGQLTLPCWLSLRPMFVSMVLPLLVMTYVHVTVLPTLRAGPVTASASKPLVYFTTLMLDGGRLKA